MEPETTEFLSSQCRICLADGDIPIFGKEPTICEDIITFGDVQVAKNDDLPQHICDSCFQLLTGAKVFRNAAKHSDDFMKNMLRKGIFSGSSNISSDISEASDVQCFHEKDIESMKSVIEDSDCVSNIETHSLAETDSMIDTQSIAETQSMTETHSITDTHSLAETQSLSESEINDNETLIVIIESQSDSEDNTSSISHHDNITYCNKCNMNFACVVDYNKHILSDLHILAENSKIISGHKLSEKQHESQIEIHKTNEPETPDILNHTSESQIETMEEIEENSNLETPHDSLEKSQQKVQCKVCKKFVTKPYLKTHAKLHGGEKEKALLLRQCPYCKKSVNYSYYSAHLKRMHNTNYIQEKRSHPLPMQPKQYICDKCGKVFKKKHNLELHILTHGSELNFKCMFCPYRGRHLGLLKIHIRTHTKDYNYKCTQCPAKFITKSNLSKHMFTHESSGSFKCELCEKQFYSKHGLKVHNEVIHFNGYGKIHCCSICGKAFKCRSYMLSHELKYHKRKKFVESSGRIPSYLAIETKEHTEDQEFIKV